MGRSCFMILTILMVQDSVLKMRMHHDGMVLYEMKTSEDNLFGTFCQVRVAQRSLHLTGQG